MVCGVVLGEWHIFVGLGRRIVCRSEVFCESITDRSVGFSIVDCRVLYHSVDIQGSHTSPRTLGFCHDNFRYCSVLCRCGSHCWGTSYCRVDVI